MVNISILLAAVVIIILLGFLIYLNVKSDSQKTNSKESLKDLDKAVERQGATLRDLSRDIQSSKTLLVSLIDIYRGGP